ncbi:MAG: NTP transferase domain-containing protein [Candidatus Marinimicrobia bacterium]|nr:NTP transferase domain-containing protein [Candidatus Neomarinimicrobiota bacterium]
MKVIIPVAGKGERLMPHTAQRQKALLPVGGKPVLDYIIEPLIAAGIDEIVLIVGHGGDQVREHMTLFPQVQSSFVEQKRPLGLGHAVSLGLDSSDAPAGIVLADSIFRLDYARFFDRRTNYIGVVEVDHPQRFGIVETDGSRIVDMVEKPSDPPTNLAIAGIYQVARQGELLATIEGLMENDVRTKGEYQLTDALKSMMGRGAQFQSFALDEWLDCGTEQTLLETNSALLEETGESFVHPSATVEGSFLMRSAVMERCEVVDSQLTDCIVLPGAKIRGCRFENAILAAGVTWNANEQAS